MLRDFSRVNGRHFDVLVCGGGIYGAWTAYDAAARGLKVALLDQGDWACATSSASSKLIHGGLRYLELFDFKLVRKTLAERQMLLETAPHRVWPLRFGVPVYRDSRIGLLKLAVGLSIYDRLAGALPDRMKYRRFSSAGFAERFPFLASDGLRSGVTYFDAQTDDARLVLELVDGAQTNGAVCVNYCKVTGFLENQGQLIGGDIQDQVSGETGVIYAAQVVNAAGQWSSNLQQENPDYRLSKGVHLVMPKIMDNEALLLTAKADGRVFFMMPWYGMTLIGTTDDNYDGDIDQIKAEPSDIDYLLNEVNRVVKGVDWSILDVVACFAGLRVLQKSEQKSPSRISRDWELKISQNGLLSSIGGKLTSARADAEIIVNRLCQNLGLASSAATFGKAFPWLPESDYQEWTRHQMAEASALGIDHESAQWLLRRHGKRAPEVFRLARERPELTNQIFPGLPFILADLVFCARSEMVVHLEDLLRRRVPLLILTRVSPEDLLKLAKLAAKELNWDHDKMHHEYLVCKKKWLEH